MALYLQIPVQRTCIHKSPVHGAYNHNMDGNAWYFTLGFPSISLAYIYFPSRRMVYSIPCHRSHLLSFPLSSSLNFSQFYLTVRHLPSRNHHRRHISAYTQQPRLLSGFVTNSGNSRGRLHMEQHFYHCIITARGWITFYSAVIFLRQPLIQFLSASRPAQLQAAPLLRQTGKSIRPDRSCRQS